MAGRAVLWAYVVVGVANVLAVATQSRPAEVATKVALMPLLVVWVVADARGRPFAWPVPLRWLLVGLGCAWLGDLLLLVDGDLWFVAGIGAFAAMQACYLVAFRTVPGPGLVRAWPVAALPYALYWVGVNVAIWPDAGGMRLPVVVYSALLVVMALAALDLVLRVPRRLGWRVAAGAALFVASDTAIALTAFGPLSSGPGWGTFVMATYVTAQAMIATGVTRAVRD